MNNKTRISLMKKTSTLSALLTLALLCGSALPLLAQESQPQPALAPQPQPAAVPAPATQPQPAAVPAPQPDRAPQINLTLKEAIRLTFQRNLDLKVELYNPALAEADIRRSLGIYDPALSAGFNYSRATTPNALTFTPLTLDQANLNLGVTQLLATGATVGASAKSGWLSDSTSFFNNSVALTLAQPLLKNFGQETTELNISVARYNKEGSLERYSAKLNDTVAQVRNDY